MYLGLFTHQIDIFVYACPNIRFSSFLTHFIAKPVTNYMFLLELIISVYILITPLYPCKFSQSVFWP